MPDRRDDKEDQENQAKRLGNQRRQSNQSQETKQRRDDREREKEIREVEHETNLLVLEASHMCVHFEVARAKHPPKLKLFCTIRIPRIMLP